MLPLVALGGALWYLARPRRNPDWITTNGVHRPIYGKAGTGGDGRSGDPTPYDDARLKEPPKTIRRSGSAAELQTSRTAYDRLDRLRRGAERAAAAKERATSILAAGDARDRQMVESFGPLGAGFRDRSGAGARARDASVKRSAAAIKAADAAAYREVSKDVRADKIEAALSAGEAEGFRIGDTVRFVRRLTPSDRERLAARGHPGLSGTIEGHAEIVDRLLHTWRLVLTRAEQRRTDSTAVAAWLYKTEPFEIAAKGSSGWGPNNRLLPLKPLTSAQRQHDQQTELETRLLRAMNRAILDMERSQDGKGTSALPGIRATLAKLTAEYERLTGKTPTFRRNKGTVILGEGRPKADAGTS